MKKNLVPLIGIALVVAIVSTGIFYGLFVGKLRNASATSPAGNVVVALRKIEPGATIGDNDVKLVSWGGPEIPKGAFTTLDQVKGMRVIYTVQQNEPILALRVASASGGGAGLGIPVGMRAVSTHVSDSMGVVSLLESGHHVDVQLVSIPGSGSELRTVLQNISVLRVDPAPDSRTLPVVTLLVRPEEADVLGLGDSTARIRLSLRNPLDDEEPTLSRHTLTGVFQTQPTRRLTITKQGSPQGQ
jgi:Flp pilus assembly protein CpaB